MAEERAYIEEEYDEEQSVTPEVSLKDFRVMWETLHQSGAYDTLLNLAGELRDKEKIDVVVHRQVYSDNGREVSDYIRQNIPRLQGTIAVPLRQNRNGIDLAFGSAMNIYIIKRPLEINDIKTNNKMTVGDAIVVASDPTGVLRIWGERTKVESDGLAHTEERLPFIPRTFLRSEQQDRNAIRAAILGAHFSDPKAKTPLPLK